MSIPTVTPDQLPVLASYDGILVGAGTRIGRVDIDANAIADAEANAAIAAAAAAALPTPVANSVVAYNASAVGEMIGLGVNAGRKLRNRVTREIDIADYMTNDPAVTAGEINTAWDAFIADILTNPRPVTLRIPTGSYLLNRSLQVNPSFPLEVGCEGGYSTRFVAGAGTYTLGAMLGQATPATLLSHFRLHGGTFNGNAIAGYGYRFDNVTHSIFDNQEIIGCLNWAARLNGYSNSIYEPKYHSNTGGGLDVSGTGVIAGLGNSNFNCYGGIIYNNDGIGAKLADGWAMALWGTGIEGNDLVGLLSHDVDGLNVRGCYFERNGNTGLTLLDGASSVTPRVDIMLLSGDAQLTYPSRLEGVSGAVIDGCSFTPYGSYDVPTPGLLQDGLIFATSLDKVRFTNNSVRGVAANLTAAVRFWPDNRNTKIDSLVMEQNDREDILALGAGNSSFALSTSHKISNRYTPLPFNYASQVRTDYPAIAGTTGALTTHTSLFGGGEVWQVTPGDRLWAYEVTKADHPELFGDAVTPIKRVYFALSYRVLDAATVLKVYCGGHIDNNGTATEGVTPAGVWLNKSCYREIDNTQTSFFIVFEVTGPGVNGVLVSKPVCTVVGTDLQTAMAAT